MLNYFIKDYFGRLTEININLDYVNEIYLCEDMGDQTLHVKYIDGHEDKFSAGSFDGDYDSRELIYKRGNFKINFKTLLLSNIIKFNRAKAPGLTRAVKYYFSQQDDKSFDVLLDEAECQGEIWLAKDILAYKMWRVRNHV